MERGAILDRGVKENLFEKNVNGPHRRGGCQLGVYFGKKDVPGRKTQEIQRPRGTLGVLEEQRGVNWTRLDQSGWWEGRRPRQGQVGLGGRGKDLNLMLMRCAAVRAW